MVKLKKLLLEKTVRLSTMKDASFEPGQFVQILGKKGKVKLDKKSVKYLAKWIRSNSGKHGMGWSFTEGKLTEVSAGVNVFYFYKKANKDKNKFFKMLSDFRKKHSDTKWMKMLNYALVDFNENPKKYKTIDDKQNKLFKNLQQNKKVYEGKLNEAKTLTLPNGVKAIIDFKGIKFKASKGAPVFLDRDELLKFFRGSTKYLRYT